MVYRNYPIPPEDEQATCSVHGCLNAATALLVIRMPHQSLFDRKVWGEDRVKNVAPATATISLCEHCALKAAGIEQGRGKSNGDDCR